MPPPLEENTTKLYVDNNGHVWYAKHIGPITNSNTIVDEFLRSSVLAGFGNSIRLLGIPQNAELISELHLRRYRGGIQSIEVAGVNILEKATDLTDPRLVLMQMRSATVPTACGGWHQLTQYDYPTYAMLGRMLKTNFVVDALIDTYLKLHPALKAAQFIPTLNTKELAKLLITIIDPRWYVDSRAPERAAKLELFLGLIPDTQKQIADPKRILRKNREFRCLTVLNTWKTKPIAEVDLRDPANFLYRIAASRGGHIGDLRASQAFIRYLRANWLAVLEQRAGIKDQLFAPDLFFKTAAEAAAFKAHIEKE